ncbi:MAG TPA: TonB family protein [Vicinamibacterales bacterium]|nr:TonB family protein [Vicinamibacterales bacterium]
MAWQGLRSHLTGSVPISIGFHLVALLLLFIIPLTANVVLPVVAVSLPDFVRVAPAPPPPEVLVRPMVTSRSAPSETRAPAPTAAPTMIRPEVERPVFNPGPVLPDPTGGLPPGAGGLPLGPAIAVPPAPEPPKQTGPVRVADLPVAPRKTVDVRPIYPDFARAARIEGTVVMEAVLDPSGHVTQLRVIQSVPMLDQAAIDAVRQWRYSPSLYGGHPVSVLMTITIRFKLQ